MTTSHHNLVTTFSPDLCGDRSWAFSNACTVIGQSPSNIRVDASVIFDSSHLSILLV